MQRKLQTIIGTVFVFGVPVLLSIIVALGLGYFSMATKPSNQNLNGIFDFLDIEMFFSGLPLS